MPLAWNAPDAWILSTEQPTFACAPPYVGNGRLGLRLGALILGTDRGAPPLTGAGAEACHLAVPRFDHSWPLQSFAAHGRDGFQHCLPSWAQLRLRIGNSEFRPGCVVTGSRRPLTTSLDLRTGEAGLDGAWMVDGRAVAVRIRLLIPRSIPHGAFWELELDGMPAAAEVEFGLDGDHLVDDLDQEYRIGNGELSAELRTRRRGRAIALGQRWQAEGATVAGVDCAAGHARVRLVSTGPRLRLTVCYACHGGTEAGGAREVAADLDALQRGLLDGSLRRGNERLWRALWDRGLDVTALPLPPVDRRFVLAQQFYLLASYDGSAHLVAPLGLSGNQWRGTQLWDADLWHGRALAILWPSLARQLLRARLAMLPAARERARALGLRGARFPWMSDEEGAELTPEGPYREELHVNAWSMLLAWDLWRTTGDRAILEEAWPLLAEVAEFWCARSERGADGTWHLRRLLGPDEAVHENPRNPQLCDDNLATNLAVRTALRAATAAAGILGRTAAAEWEVVAAGLALQQPDDAGVIPEYAGYDGHAIKQADAILAFFPLDLRLPPEQVEATVAYYHERMLSGPLMSEQIEAAIRLRLGREAKEAVLGDLVRAYRRCVRGAFEVPYEVNCNSNSVMLTACGGLLNALACGWWAYREPGDDGALIPRLGCGAGSAASAAGGAVTA